jgi:hypothetical protein
MIAKFLNKKGLLMDKLRPLWAKERLLVNSEYDIGIRLIKEASDGSQGRGYLRPMWFPECPARELVLLLPFNNNLRLTISLPEYFYLKYNGKNS